MIDGLVEILGDDRVKRDCNLKDLTTFKVGGPAKAVVSVENDAKLCKVISYLKEKNVPFFVIGNGSNLLVSDDGYDGVAVKLTGEYQELRIRENEITAGAGVILSKVCTFARDNSLSGLEFAYGIPGTVGGAMVMNAGAYDGEMAFVVKTVDLMDENGNIRTFSNEEMAFGYRDSLLKHSSYIALRTVYSLKSGQKSDIQAKMDDFMERRRSKQPLEYPSAGSTFKRPMGNYAGKLIMEAGLSGKRVGGASVSEKHCGFVINDKNAKASEIDELMQEIVKEVRKKSGVTLEPEVIKIGNFTSR